MSKIVYLTPPAQGHVNPTLPVVQELIKRGEAVTCYNIEAFRPQFERTGAAFRAYPTTGLTPAGISHLLQNGNLANMTVLILQATGQILPFLLNELSDEKPDLIIFDSLALWGKMAATQLRLPNAASVTHFVLDEKQMTIRDLLRMLTQSLPKVPKLLLARRQLVRQYGSAYPSAGPLFPMLGDLNIIFTIQALQPPTPMIDQRFHFVGTSINPQIRKVDFPFHWLKQKPIVYISMGTIHRPEPTFIQACFAAFADFPAQFIFSVGEQAEIGAIPANFIVRPSVPQLEILQQADIFISHGGLNSIHEGLYYGVPFILIPHQFEQLMNARCVAGRGAGIVIEARLRGQAITATTLRQALTQLSAEEHYRQSAKELQTALRASGGYQQATDTIQAYLKQLGQK